MMDERGSSSPKRKRRITRACDQCHRTNTKCAPGPTPSTCQNCYDFASPCTYDRPVLRRGPRTGSVSNGDVPPTARRRKRPRQEQAGWVYEEVSDHRSITSLADAYHSIVYPIFPLFHWPTFTARIHAREYTRDPAFFATTMAVCAIVTARLRAGAVLPHLTETPASFPHSETLANAAILAFPASLSEAGSFEFMRAKALLAILFIQYGDVVEHRTHLGEFVVLASNTGLHDEHRWDKGLSETQRQEKRRLFWSIYTLEIYSAITWGGIVRFRESQSNVTYPAEVDDEDIPFAAISSSSTGITYPPPQQVSFMRGWNFTTDMYRILEHIIARVRASKPPDPGAAFLEDLFKPQYPSSKEVLDRLDHMHSGLPEVFKSVQPMTGNLRTDRYGFQAANIIVTLQTVKLTLALAEDHGVEQRCAFAGELINALASIPTAYIAAVSRPMLHHLASCGHLLGSVVNRPLSQWALLQVRGVLLAMSDLLSGLEKALNFPSDISNNLRSHVTKIEGYLADAARDAQNSEVFHSALPGVPSRPGRIRPHTPTPLPSPAMYNPFDDVAAAPTQMIPMPEGFTFELPQEHQVQLQTDLMSAWPDWTGGLFDVGDTSTLTGSDWLFGLPGASTA